MKPSVIAIFGPPNTLKTSIALSILDLEGFKGCLRVYDFDLGFDRAWGSEEKVADGRVELETMFLPTRDLTRKDTTMVGHSELWAEFTDNFQKDCKNPLVGGIVWDTSTSVWALCRDAYLQEIQRGNSNRKQLLQIEYGEPNQRMNRLFAMAKAHKTYLISVHHETDEYITVTMGGRPVLDQDGNPKTATSGKKLPDGFRYTTGKADWVLYTYEQDGEPWVRIEKTAEGWQIKGSPWKWFTFGQLDQIIAAYKGLSAAPPSDTPITFELPAAKVL